jgi:hypothetical protein
MEIETVADALPNEIARIGAKRDRWIKMAADHPSLAPGMNITIAIMQHEIMQAVRASTDGDVIEMTRSLEGLKAYSDDD